MAGYVVAPTYPFPITYQRGGGIHPHLDVSDNELSLTFQVQLEGGQTILVEAANLATIGD